MEYDIADEFVRRMADKGGYKKSEVSLLLPKINQLCSTLQDALKRWLDSGDILDVEIEGYSIQGLMENSGLSFVAAVLTLDWLRREPENAKLAIARGYDEIR